LSTGSGTGAAEALAELIGTPGLRELLAEPERALVALDFDGTLSPIVADPEAARAHPDALPALRRLAPRVGTAAILTGRPAEVVVRNGGFSGAAGLDGLIVLGHYGAERWDASTGRVTAEPPPPGVAAVRTGLPELLKELPDGSAAPEGTWIEDKGRSLAVHTRRTADPDAALTLLRAPLTALAERSGLIVEPGHYVLELRPPGVDKGSALRGLARERGARGVLYAGDDLGDLPAFRAAHDLGGCTVAVGDPSPARGGEAPLRPELAALADAVVRSPAELARLLAGLAATLG
jgi:trehalose 6-phosphate phosphatase